MGHEYYFLKPNQCFHSNYFVNKILLFEIKKKKKVRSIFYVRCSPHTPHLCIEQNAKI